MAERIVADASRANEAKQAKARARMGKATPTAKGGEATPTGGRSAGRAPPKEKRGPPERTQSLTSIAHDDFTTSLASFTSSAGEDLSAPYRAREVAAREARLGLKNLVEKCRANTEVAVDVLVDVMTKSTHAPSRVAAAKAVIEFGHGRAPETIRLEKIYSADELRRLAEAIALRRLREGSVDGGQLGGASGEYPKR